MKIPTDAKNVVPTLLQNEVIDNKQPKIHPFPHEHSNPTY
ncbi:Uncharacterised protein [Yersinia intermedia]|nr:Uncharacterised protein [Yersinia intermedia]CNH24739.1 Uncharacterised protein [Yersinia intermedia]